MSILPFDDRDGVIWYNGELIQWRDANFHVLSHALHYGSCVFEGQRAYGGKIFKLHEHSERLIKSGAILGMEVPYTADELDTAADEVVTANNLVDAYVRPVAWRGSEMMGVATKGTKTHVAIAAWEWPSYFGEEAKKKGLRLEFAKWRRPAPGTAPTESKAAGLYMICTLSKHAAEKDGYRGFANTVKAHMLLQVLSMLDDNGIRIDVADPENIGPFVNKGQPYSDMLTLLDLGFSQLNSASFAFQLSTGFSGFNTPSSFGQYNRAVAAKTALYSEDYDEAAKVVVTSFLDLNGDLSIGPKHVFSNSSGDIQNPLFKAAGQSGDQLVVHNDFINNATAGDARLSKFRARINTPSQDDLNGTHETALFASSTSSIDIIRNEELILIYAEANMQTGNLAEAVTATNIIRNAAGIGDYTGAVEKEALIDELLYQRSYSLWGEGNRMFDMRRYGRLNSNFLPIDRPGHLIHEEFPIPLTEGQ